MKHLVDALAKDFLKEKGINFPMKELDPEVDELALWGVYDGDRQVGVVELSWNWKFYYFETGDREGY